MSIKIRNIPLASSIFHTGKRLLKTFHALPLSHTNSIIDSKYREEYEYLFKTPNNIGITVTDPFIDSPARPHTAFAAAEELAAIAFDADRTLFITGGSTLAIQIAITSLNKASRKSVLACKGLHQSIYFATDNIVDKIDYVSVININNHTAQTYTNLPVLLEIIVSSEANKQPYKTILLNGITYEGIVQDLDYTLDEIAKAGPSIRHDHH